MKRKKKSAQSAAMNLRLDWCSYKAARWACENWHYSGCIPVGKLVKIGVWEDGKFIGVVIYSHGASPYLLARYGLGKFEGCELTRVALTEHRTEVTRIVSVSLKMLARLCPKLKVVVSFADPEMGHDGTIYRAGNWIYGGVTSPTKMYLFKGKRWHVRTFHGKKLKFKNSATSQDYTEVEAPPKHRYLYPLNKTMLPTLRSFEEEFVSLLRRPTEGGCSTRTAKAV